MTWLLSILLVGAVLALIRQSRAARALRAENERLEQQLQVVEDLPSLVAGSDWQRSLQELTGFLVANGGCRAAVLLSLSDNGNLELRASAYAFGELVWGGLGESVGHQALDSKKPLALGADELILPILEEAEPLGVLAVRGARSGEAVLTVALRLAGLILSGARMARRQSALSTTDGLTGLSNHRHFQQMLGIALGQAYLEGEALSLILLDIDHFKRVNDTYGHLLGDLVLRELAYLLRRELPPGALAARYGGEEMAVLLQGESAVCAAEIAERLRKTIENHQILDFTTGSKLNVTVSLGVAAYELGQGKSRLIGRTDEALYASKREGRNRVTVAAPEDGTSHLFPS